MVVSAKGGSKGKGATSRRRYANPSNSWGASGRRYGICVFGHKLASTGVTEAIGKKYGLDLKSTYFQDADRCEFMNEYGEVALKLVYEKDTFRLVGAQVASRGKDNHSEVMYYLGLAIQQELTLFDLALTDVYFLPHYNKPFNFILSTILKALNVKL